jgi:hypothetical protein
MNPGNYSKRVPETEWEAGVAEYENENGQGLLNDEQDR